MREEISTHSSHTQKTDANESEDHKHIYRIVLLFEIWGEIAATNHMFCTILN